MLGHRKSPNTFLKIEFIQTVLSNHNGKILEINSRGKPGKITNCTKLNTALLNNQWVKESQGILENILRQMKVKYSILKVWNAEKAVLKRKLIPVNASMNKLG